jgi:hypothetical protein
VTWTTVPTVSQRPRERPFSFRGMRP